MRPLNVLLPRRCDPKIALGWRRYVRRTRCRRSGVTRRITVDGLPCTQRSPGSGPVRPNGRAEPNDDKCFSTRQADAALTLRTRRSPKAPLDPISGSLFCQQVCFDDHGAGCRPTPEEADHCRNHGHSRWRTSSDRSRVMTNCHRGKRAAGCRTRRCESQRFRSRRWTFVRATFRSLLVWKPGVSDPKDANSGSDSRARERAHGFETR